MEDEFQKRTVLCYSNFMNYIISFSVFNIIILIIENSSIIYSVDLMMDGDKVLNELFTPFYFLSPHLYIEMLNEKFPNQCFQIFDFNSIMLEYEEANKEKEEDDDDNGKNKEKENTKDNNVDSTIESTQALRNIDEKIINTKKKKRLKKERNKLKHKWKKRRIDNEGNNESTTDGLELQEDESEEEEEDEEDEDPMVAMYKRITEERYYDIKFKGKTLYSLDTSYCVYNKNLIYISYAIVILLFLLSHY